MLPSFYQTIVEKHLSQSQLITLKMLVWLLQLQKQVRIERLAATLPLPIKYESRRRHIQRFLNLKKLSLVLFWFPLLKEIISRYFTAKEQLIIAIDRTQWAENNILMASVLLQKRAIPLYWILLDKDGATSLAEQQKVLRPVIRLLKHYKLVIIGDREFHSVELAHWLHSQHLGFVFRQQKSTTFRQKRQQFKPLSSIPIHPGIRIFYTDIIMTQNKGFGRFNLAVYWRRKYNNKQEDKPWYLLTNMTTLEHAVKIYGLRFGIEAMFKDCKTGGYNLEGSQASPQKLTHLILLIALAMTSAWFRGQRTQLQRVSTYVCRPIEPGRTRKRHSNFWIGLYGCNWIATFDECQLWVREMMTVVRNKLPFYLRGLNAMKLIQQPF